MENHYMVILTIPKITADVNDFQKSINILLIINNLLFGFLGILTHFSFADLRFINANPCKACMLYI